MALTGGGLAGSLAAGLGKASLFCKVMYAVLVVGHLASYSETLFFGLAITPRNLLPPNFWLWTVGTYFVVERNFIVLLADVCAVHLCGSVLEPAWTGVDLSIYLGVVISSVALIGTSLLLLASMIVSDVGLLFDTHLHGLSGFVGALLVAVKQLLPDSTLLRTPAGRVKNTHLPLLTLCLSSVLVLCQALRPQVLLMYTIGAYSGWLYLRYFQRHANGAKGDMSDHFSFPSLFPSWMNGPVEMAASGAYRLLVRLGCCTPAIRQLRPDQLTGVTIAMPGMGEADAERRRAKALRELSDRLAQAKPETPWPAMEEEASQPPLQPHSPGQASPGDGASPAVAAAASPASPADTSADVPVYKTVPDQPLLQLSTPPNEEQKP